jgi:RNA polymerase sigma-70 factor (ECF subfamily)
MNAAGAMGRRRAGVTEDSETDGTRDDAALLALVRRLAMAYAVRCVGYDRAQDLVQDLCIKVWERRKVEPDYLAAGTDDPASIGPIVRIAVRRALLDARRQSDRAHHREQRHHDETAASEHGWMLPESRIAERELAAVIQDTVNALPERCRAAYRCVRDDNMTYKQAAGALGMAERTVNTHLANAQRLIRQAVVQYETVSASRDIRAHKLRAATEALT